MQHDTRLLEGKNAIITGARRGIGKAIVQVFSEMGANVWACIRRPDEAVETELSALFHNGSWIRFIYFDMMDEGGMKDAVKEIRSGKKNIDILVNNAGMSYDALLPMLSMGKVQELFDVNFFSHVKFTQLVSRLMMRQKKGCIINISSYLAEDGNRGQSMYSASKAAMNAFTISLAEELADYHIRVNAVAPGVVNTDMVRSMGDGELDALMRRCPLHRPAEPVEIGNAVVFLASDMSTYINGQVIRVDGGM